MYPLGYKPSLPVGSRALRRIPMRSQQAATLLRQACGRRPALSSLFTTRVIPFSSVPASLLHSADSESSSLEVPADSLSARVERLPNGTPILSAFQSWMGDGFPVHRGDVFHTINRLRKLRMNKRALEVMEWVVRERPYKLKELEYSYLVEFTIKLHGISSGEGLFTRIPAEFQNELLYNNLVMACLDKGVIRLSLAYMKRMRELNFNISPYVFNHLIVLHSSSDRRKMIPKILSQMKADGVSAHVSTYNILLKIEADDHNIEGLSKVFADMTKAHVEANEITYGILSMAHAVARLYTVSEVYAEAIERKKTGSNWSTLEILLILYGYLRLDKELERTWKAVQDLPHIRSQSFCLAVEAFGRLGWVARSEELWSEMKSSGRLKSTKQFNSIISVYCRHGLLDKTSEVFKEMERKGCSPNAITYRHLTFGCLKANLVKEAIETLEIGKNQVASFQVRRSIPWLETTYLIMDAFAQIGDLENAKRLFLELKESRYSRYTFVHNALLKAFVKAKVYDSDLLKNMILSGARPDAETYSLLWFIEHQKT